MAVIFGRTATTTLNRGVQLVVTPDFKVEPPPVPPDVTPDPVDWADISYDASDNEYTVAVQQITGISTPITLEVTGFFGILIGYVRVDNFEPSWTNGGVWDGNIAGWTVVTTSPYQLTVTNGQYVSFGCEPDGPSSLSRTITVKNNSDDGFTIDTFVATLDAEEEGGGCYLTTATVQYKGLEDNGPELTAMRALREHYRGDTYYDSLIEEYYQNSKQIITGINNSSDPGSEYEFIYQSVLKVKSFVDNQQWEQAKDEYVNTYLILKNRYIN
jgi:hypothetical protein